jgi:hypothetical protein
MLRQEAVPLIFRVASRTFVGRSLQPPKRLSPIESSLVRGDSGQVHLTGFGLGTRIVTISEPSITAHIPTTKVINGDAWSSWVHRSTNDRSARVWYRPKSVSVEYPVRLGIHE